MHTRSYGDVEERPPVQLSPSCGQFMSVGGHGICKQTTLRQSKALDSRREYNLFWDRYMQHCNGNVYAKLWRDRGTNARPAGDCQFVEFQKVATICSCLLSEPYTSGYYDCFAPLAINYWIREGNTIYFGTDTCNIAMAMYMRRYGETEERMHDLRAIYVNLSNFKRWRQFVRICWGNER
jgi:hypothetical protein